ncbi:hypothetical protein HK102_002076, partial [Quaeritorhiza haematococci]
HTAEHKVVLPLNKLTPLSMIPRASIFLAVRRSGSASWGLRSTVPSRDISSLRSSTLTGSKPSHPSPIHRATTSLLTVHPPFLTTCTSTSTVATAGVAAAVARIGGTRLFQSTPAVFAAGAGGAGVEVVEAGDAELDRIATEAGDMPFIVDFYADWCPPCKQLDPVLKKAVGEQGKFKLVKVNVDHNPGSAEKYQVTALPTVAAIKNGQVVSGFVGYRDAKTIKEFLDDVQNKFGAK